ncbi:MAG: ABC transporter, partial [Clostridia bacterium]|nr:ABC transporter [Clostridia bacterium]
MKKIIALLLAVLTALTLVACGGTTQPDDGSAKTYKIGICNYVDDASLNQIVDNITARLTALGEE